MTAAPGPARRANRRFARLASGCVLLSMTVLCGCVRSAGQTRSDPNVIVEPVPGGGVQPDSVAAADGTIHVVFLKGDPARSDVYYARRAPGGRWSDPVRVNSEPGSAVALGTVRGAQVALGAGGRVHVMWTGSAAATPRPGGGAPVLYARSAADGRSFEPQRSLVSWAFNVDGGGSIAADGRGRVYVVWHAGPARSGEAHRVVVIARSEDEGATFARERSIGAPDAGACACCWLRARADDSGHVWVLYRAARNGTGRDAMLLTSADQGRHFASRVLQRWKAAACPLSSFELAPLPGGVLAAWEQGGQIHMQRLMLDGEPAGPIEAPGHGSTEKHPAIAVNHQRLLVAWTTDTGWAKGGSFAWRLKALASKDAGTAGAADGVPVWSRVTAAGLPDGRFVLFH